MSSRRRPGSHVIAMPLRPGLRRGGNRVRSLFPAADALAGECDCMADFQ